MQVAGQSPAGGVPGGQNSNTGSACLSCGCPREIAAKGNDIRNVCPNVPSHDWFKFRKGNRQLKFRKLGFFFALGAGAGAGAAILARDGKIKLPCKKKKDRSGRVSVTNEKESEVGSAQSEEDI
jgi:hypothetical protein